MSDLRAMLGDRYEALASAISATVSDWLGHDTPYNPHDWRCEDYPGPCGHDEVMAGGVMSVLDDILPGLLAQAWDGGTVAGADMGLAIGERVLGIKTCYPEVPTNPYRQELP